MKSRKLFSLKRSVLAFMLCIGLVAGPVLTAFAEDDAPYYSTWAEYQESGQPSSTWVDVANAMDAVFDHGIELFEAGDYQGAYDCVNDGYYGYYETTGFERIAMGYIAGSRKTEVELQFSACKAVAKKQGSLDEFTAEIDTLKSMIRTDAHILDGTDPDEDEAAEGSAVSEEEMTEEERAAAEAAAAEEAAAKEAERSAAAAAAAFAACFSIMLREGFEAILIVGAIIAYLRKKAGDDKKEQKKQIYPVYIGSVLGIILSFVLAWLLDAIKLANSASQEIIEGVTALIAVCVLYYVGNWMLSKSESDAWISYIKSKAEAGSEKGSMFALAATAFLAVFREGAEVVLFFQPMLAGDNIDMVWAGFGVGCVALVFVYLAIHFLSIKIPIKPFFTFTSALMMAMAISFLGAGIKELIEGDVIMMTSPSWLQWIPSNDVMDILGIYPCLETIVPQLILLAVTIVLWIRTTHKNKLIHLEAEKARAEERAREEAERKAEEERQLRILIRSIVEEVLEGKAAEPAAVPEAAAQGEAPKTPAGE